jgi:hypothetical protein
MLSSKTDFFRTKKFQKTDKNNPIPEDIEQVLSGKSFQFRNEIGYFRSAEHQITPQEKSPSQFPLITPKFLFLRILGKNDTLK